MIQRFVRSAFSGVVVSILGGFQVLPYPMAAVADSADRRVSATGGDLCWSPIALQGRPADKTIRKGLRAAMVGPPEGDLVAFSPIPTSHRGVIRRVELPRGVMKVALTFDLCEQPNEVAGYDGEIVNYLRQQNVRATFFSGGKWLATHQEQARQLTGDPLFEMGNHTWTHRNLRLLTDAEIANEIRWTQLAYEQQMSALADRNCVSRDGRRVTKTKLNERMSLFRFPFGACNATSLNLVGDLGLVPIQWDVSSGDPSPRVSAEAMAADVTRRVRPGSIVLFHANGRGWHTAQALPFIVKRLRDLGYDFVTVTELLNTKGASVDRGPICFDSKPGDTNRYDALARRLEAAYAKFKERYGSEKAGPPSQTAVSRSHPR